VVLVEAYPVEAHPVEAHPVEVYPVEAHPVEVYPVEAHPVEVYREDPWVVVASVLLGEDTAGFGVVLDNLDWEVIHHSFEEGTAAAATAVQV